MSPYDWDIIFFSEVLEYMDCEDVTVVSDMMIS